MPSQHRKCRTFLVAVVSLMLMAMPSMTTAGGKDNNKQVFTQLVAGSRPVFFFAKLANHSLLVVGSLGAAALVTTSLDDTFVLKLKVTGSGNKTTALLKSIKKIKSVWSQFTGPYKAMFAVGESIVLVGADSSASVLDIKGGTISKMTLEKKYVTFLQTSQLLSSNKAPTFYYINPNDKSEFVSVAFDTTNLAQSTKIVFSPAANRHLCNADHDQIMIQLASCQPGSVTWSIIAGYVDDTDFMLVEQQSNSIISFSKNAFDKEDGSPVPLFRIVANQFWRYPKATARPIKKHTILTSTDGSSSLGVIIGIVCFVLLLIIIIPVGIYCTNSKPPKPRSSDSLSKSAFHVRSKRTRSGNLTKRNSTQRKTSMYRSKFSQFSSKSIGSSSSKRLTDPKDFRNLPLEVQLAVAPSADPILIPNSEYRRMMPKTIKESDILPSKLSKAEGPSTVKYYNTLSFDVPSSMFKSKSKRSKKQEKKLPDVAELKMKKKRSLKLTKLPSSGRKRNSAKRASSSKRSAKRVV